MSQKYLYADESGNFDFRDPARYPGATKYFAVGTLMIRGEGRMRALRNDLADLRYELVRNGHEYHESFHAAEDPQPVRDAVFETLRDHKFKIDVTILEKSKAQPQTRRTNPLFYKYAWYYHLKWFSDRYFKPDDQLMVVSAGLGTKKTRNSFRAAVEDVVDQCCQWEVNREFAFWKSETDPCLQAADYVLWAVMRQVERGDSRSRKLIEDKVNSVYDLWSQGTRHYY